MKTRTRLWWLGLGLGLSLHALDGQAQGTIRYVDPPDVWFVRGETDSLPVDLDGNGATDYLLHIRAGWEFMLVGLGQNASLALPATPPDMGSYLLPLTDASKIPFGPLEPFTWVTSYILSTDPIAGPYYVAPVFHARATTGTVGFWNNVEGYAGLQFEIDGQMHFGWLRIETDSFRTGGTLKDWAYNTLPGQPILAGQVPEPAVGVLLASGSLVLLLFKRFRQRRVVRLPASLVRGTHPESAAGDHRSHRQ